MFIYLSLSYLFAEYLLDFYLGKELVLDCIQLSEVWKKLPPKLVDSFVDVDFMSLVEDYERLSR